MFPVDIVYAYGTKVQEMVANERFHKKRIPEDYSQFQACYNNKIVINR